MRTWYLIFIFGMSLTHRTEVVMQLIYITTSSYDTFERDNITPCFVHRNQGNAVVPIYYRSQ